MQRALKRVIGQAFPQPLFRENIRLQADGHVLTDVDFVVIDAARGTIVLCQLKAQDLYGADIRVRGTKMGRLNREVSGWISTVRRWLDLAGKEKLRQSLGLPARTAVRDILFLTITHHYAHSLKEISVDDDTAFATVLQLFNAIELMKKQQGSFMTLKGLFEHIRKHVVQAVDQVHLEEGDREYQLDTLRFSVSRAG